MTDETIPDDIMQAAKLVYSEIVPPESRFKCDVISIARALMAERAKCAEELASLKRLKSAYKAKNASKTRLLERVREVISDLVAYIVDEGDRAYFGSTNDADELRDLATKIEGWKWDDILRQSDGDPYATIREQRSRADAAETELATIRAENDRLREALAVIDRYEIFADVSLVNQIFRLKNSARAALKGGE